MTGPYSDEELEAAVEALSDPERFREAEALVAKVAPTLQRVLTSALEAGGWFAESHETAVNSALGSEDPAERARQVRTLFVGVAVGWALREELGRKQED
jgi:hypothetical protein